MHTCTCSNIRVCMCTSRAQLFATPWTVACTKLLHPWDFLSKSTVVGCYFLLQGIFPTQGSNPGLPHCRQTLYHLSHQGSPRILEWVAIPFSRRSSQPRDWTWVSHIVGRRFTVWATSWTWLTHAAEFLASGMAGSSSLSTIIGIQVSLFLSLC